MGSRRHGVRAHDTGCILIFEHADKKRYGTHTAIKIADIAYYILHITFTFCIVRAEGIKKCLSVYRNKMKHVRVLRVRPTTSEVEPIRLELILLIWIIIYTVSRHLV